MVNLAINGICGKMGKRILRLALKDQEIKVVVGFEQDSHPEVGGDLEGVKVSSDYSDLESCDCVIDFSAPEGTMSMLKQAQKAKKAVIIGTTGLDKAQQGQIKEAAKITPVVYSPNMSVGVNLFFKLLKEAASILKGYKPAVKEAHHIHKKDAPSGTAKKLAEIINSYGFGLKLEDIEAKREDEIIGDHEVAFDSSLESFTIGHHAKTRDIFAQGALTASKWIKDKPAGLYSMQDVLFGN